MDPTNSPEAPPGMRRALAFALPAIVAMTTFVTWPTVPMLAEAFASHVDPYFSAWRLMWIAHALQTDPHRLFDANIFYPSTGTLAYSDATMLQGALAAPLLWAGASPVVIYNLMLLAGFVASGIGMFVLARHVTGHSGPALVAAAVFTMAPYRIEHIMHLEMQWAMWIPLTLWSLTRTVETRSWRWGGLSGVFLWLQVLSCVYYGIFLGLVLVAFVPLLLLREGRPGAAALPPLALAAALGLALTIPYALPYVENARQLGERPAWDILPLSATPINYLASAETNRWWGWTSVWIGENERRLFPGLFALLLAAAALTGRVRRHVWLYLTLALLSIELSFGLNGWLYRFLFEHLQALHGLRSPARIAIVAQCAIAMLAALGLRTLQRRFTGEHGRPATLLTAAAVVLIAIESANAPIAVERVRPPSRAAYDVYRAIRSQGPGVVLELPMPDLGTLPGREVMYAFWSAAHWNKLVNGYSGYYPQLYTETLNVMRHFPDEASLARIGRLNVRYVVVHRQFFPPGEYEALLLEMYAEPRLKPFGEFRTQLGEARLFLFDPDNKKSAAVADPGAPVVTP